MATPHQEDLSPPDGPLGRLMFALQERAAWKDLPSSPHRDGRSRSPPRPCQAMVAGMSLSSGKGDMQ